MRHRGRMDNIPVQAAKRLALIEHDHARGQFWTYTPRGSSHSGEGQWCHWVALAIRVLEHPYTPAEKRRTAGSVPNPYDDCLDLCDGCVDVHAGYWAEQPNLDLAIGSGGMITQGGDGWWSSDYGRGFAATWTEWIEIAETILRARHTERFCPTLALSS